MGIPIRIHYTLWFVFILIAWSLAVGCMPRQYPGLGSVTYWAIGQRQTRASSGVSSNERYTHLSKKIRRSKFHSAVLSESERYHDGVIGDRVAAATNAPKAYFEAPSLILKGDTQTLFSTGYGIRYFFSVPSEDGHRVATIANQFICW
jgi:hypothetical protein